MIPVRVPDVIAKPKIRFFTSLGPGMTQHRYDRTGKYNVPTLLTSIYLCECVADNECACQ